MCLSVNINWLSTIKNIRVFFWEQIVSEQNYIFNQNGLSYFNTQLYSIPNSESNYNNHK